VIGYVHWTLLDNFEWIFGYDFHYGLHEVDRESFVRTAKPSAGIYSGIVRAHAVDA
jgi:beta-glucosidase